MAGVANATAKLKATAERSALDPSRPVFLIPIHPS
jgi:hypothetical protein